ncbi:MAG: hypothetical protein JO125_14755 [Chloroflexi bacterium]|nr:hypothetical protein [Chloroflexota bacterium]
MQCKSPLLGQAKPSQPNPQKRSSGYQQSMLLNTQQPRQKSKKSWIALVAVMVVVIMSLMACADSQGQKSQSPTSTSQPIRATHTAATPRKQATEVRVSAGPAILGADSNTFIAAYGQPNANSRPANGITRLALYNNPRRNDLSVTTLGSKVFFVLLYAPPDQNWDQVRATNACLNFAPLDKIYKRSLTLYDPQGMPLAIQRVYSSASLASVFPASKFIDENGAQTTAGTFGMVLNYALNAPTHFSSCSVQVGLQGTNLGA